MPLDYRYALRRNLKAALDLHGKTRTTLKARYLSGPKKGRLVSARAIGYILSDDPGAPSRSLDLLAAIALFKSRDMELVLNNGTVVGFLCSLQYNPQYGLSLRVVDADPAFALGEMELKKREIIERLCKEGLFERNKERAVPLLPLRIGLITSAGSAAYNDFIQTLSVSRFGFKICVADAMVQGEQTERSVLRALERLNRLEVELIVIARGGGSKTDLSFLDNEAIARKIAVSTIPIWTGIGHEIDTSVLDYVANCAFKTPTAVAEELVAGFVQMRRQFDESAGTLRTLVGRSPWLVALKQ